MPGPPSPHGSQVQIPKERRPARPGVMLDLRVPDPNDSLASRTRLRATQTSRICRQARVEGRITVERAGAPPQSCGSNPGGRQLPPSTRPQPDSEDRPAVRRRIEHRSGREAREDRPRSTRPIGSDRSDASQRPSAAAGELPRPERIRPPRLGFSGSASLRWALRPMLEAWLAVTLTGSKTLTLYNLLTLGNLGWLALGVLFLAFLGLQHDPLHPEQTGRHRREAVEPPGLAEERLHRPATARPASSPMSCAAAGTSARRSSTACTSCRWSPSRRARSATSSRATAAARRPRRRWPQRASANDFQDVGAFLANGGQRGPQRQILREGTYAINLAQFVVITEDGVYYLPLRRERGGALFQRMADVHRRARRLRRRSSSRAPTTRSASSPSTTARRCRRARSSPRPSATTRPSAETLPQQLPGPGGVPRGRRPPRPPAPGAGRRHVLHQPPVRHRRADPQDGHRGRLRRRRRLLHRASAATDLSGDGLQARRAGRARASAACGASRSCPASTRSTPTPARSSWSRPPTSSSSGSRARAASHRYDENLAEVTLITKDAFEPSLPLSVVVHIDYRKAPLVIQRFGDIKRLVEQTLDPMVSAYFKNIGQTRTLIQLIQERSDIQKHRRRGDEGEVRALQPRARGGADRHAGARSGDEQDRAHPDAAARRGRSPTSRSRPTRAGEGGGQGARAARGRGRAPSSRPASPSRELTITIQSNQGKAEYQRALQQARADPRAGRGRGRQGEAPGRRRGPAGEEPGRGRGREGRAGRRRPGARHRGAGARLRRAAVPAHAAGDDALRRGHPGGRGGRGAEDRGVNGAAGAGGAPAQGSSLFESLLALLLSDRLGAKVEGPSGSRDPAMEAYRERIRQNVTGVLGGNGAK